MKNVLTIERLFVEEPSQWGLRGDPFLWKEMKSYFSGTVLPETSNDLKDLIETAFESITKNPITAKEYFKQK